MKETWFEFSRWDRWMRAVLSACTLRLQAAVLLSDMCASVCMTSAPRMHETPIPPVSSALPWCCIPGQSLAVIPCDPDC